MDIRVGMPFKAQGLWRVQAEIPLILKEYLPDMKDLRGRGCSSVKAQGHTCLLEFHGFTDKDAAALCDAFIQNSLPLIMGMSMVPESSLSVPPGGWKLQEGFWCTSAEAPVASGYHPHHRSRV